MEKSPDIKDEIRSNGFTQIHNVKFYNITPRSIKAMACNYLLRKLAVARSDATIEIWDIQHVPCLEQIITKAAGADTLEALGWCHERLFSVNTNGELIEWDLQALSPRFIQYVTGSILYCLDINRQETELAVGTEEGYISIFEIANNELNFKQLFDKQEDRVICCRFDATGNFLVTGSMGIIRIWNRQTGHAVHRIQVAKVNKVHTTETIVWTLQILNDFTIIAGDSRGYITIWNGHTAAFLEMHQVLMADVLTITVNEEEDKLICAGVEPTIRIYAKTQIKRDNLLFNNWVKFLQRRVHDNDVKTVCCLNNVIYSGGVDGYLGVSLALKRGNASSMKYGPFLQPPFVTVSSSERLLLLRYPNYLEIWRLGESTCNDINYSNNISSNSSTSLNMPQSPAPSLSSTTLPLLSASTQQTSKCLPLKDVPEKLLEFRSKHDEIIVSSALSPDGNWLCYSTNNEMRLFHFVCGVFKEKTKRKSQLLRIKDIPEQFSSPASHIIFTKDSSRLIVVNRQNKQIIIFAFLSNVNSQMDLKTSLSPPLDFVECVDTAKHLKQAIKLCIISECGQYLVAASLDHSIAVWSIYQGKYYKHLLNLPRYMAATTAIALHVEQPRLVVAYTDGKIIEYDLDEMCFTCSAFEYYLDSCVHYPIVNICLDVRNPNIFIMQNEIDMFVLEKCKQADKFEDAISENNSKNLSLKKSRKYINNNDESSEIASLKLGMHKSMEHLLHLSWLNNKELVAVNVNPISLLEQLPNAFRERKFGLM